MIVVELQNFLEQCPQRCMHLREDVETEIISIYSGGLGLRVTVDCEHSQVCKLRGESDGNVGV